MAVRLGMSRVAGLPASQKRSSYKVKPFPMPVAGKVGDQTQLLQYGCVVWADTNGRDSLAHIRDSFG